MHQNPIRTIAPALAFALSACASETTGESASMQSPEKVSEALQQVATMTSDGVAMFGTPYFGGLDESAPMVLLFHQARSNGRGEYREIAAWLNENGYRAIAWDGRAGGDSFGETNLTVEKLSDDTPTGFCDASPDLEAALDATTIGGLADKVVVWGSSYSASLVFKLAADNPNKIQGVIAFSPASGGPMENCRARMWVDNVKAPIFALRPASEMERAPSVEQREILTTAGAEFLIVENGVHGSSMLVDERTEHDMSEARAAVLAWLKTAAPTAD